MEREHVTTPFGGRSMTLGMLASQILAREIEPGKTAAKWELFRALCDAKASFGLSERSLSVLNALLTFYPHDEISIENGLVLFPSNAQLSRRAHGMAEATLRRHLAALIEAGVLSRKDSANGKRYARKGHGGSISEAFGFSVAPLLARAEDITRLAAEAEAERAELRHLREKLTICRRDVSKLIMTAMEEGAQGDWFAVQELLRGINAKLGRNPTRQQVKDTLEELDLLREEVASRLEMKMNLQKTSGNPAQNERHIQNSNPKNSHESENSSRKEPELTPAREKRAREDGLMIFPISMVLRACPEISLYGPDGTVKTWRDLMAAAVTVRSMLGVSPSAYQDACEVMGPEGAATTIACILERVGHINSAGGYLRDLTTKARRKEFSLGPMIMALMRAREPANGGIS
ncbi:replication initiation protein RepC [Ensifer adhaerens]|nr:replication initiation protein RepC [Ensifer adhaerens]